MWGPLVKKCLCSIVVPLIVANVLMYVVPLRIPHTADLRSSLSIMYELILG